MLGGINGAALFAAGCLLTPPPAAAALVSVSERGTSQDSGTLQATKAPKGSVSAGGEDAPARGGSASAGGPNTPVLAEVNAGIEAKAVAEAGTGIELATKPEGARAPEPRGGGAAEAAAAAAEAAAVPREAGLAQVAGGRRMQLLCVSMLCFGLGAWMMVVHLVRLAMDSGMDDVSAARLLTFLSLGSATMRIPMAGTPHRARTPAQQAGPHTHSATHTSELRLGQP